MTDGDRPRLHLTPPSGWINDPNGLAFRDDGFHAFFQYEPDRPRWGRMHWGHAVSRDLVTWEQLPVALAPGEDGPDQLGCWSGCLVDDPDRATIFYTGVVRDHGMRRASICSATSTDGLRTWVKDPGGPVIPRPPSGIRPDRFRDPFVWRDGDGWAMLVGAGTKRARGAVLLYRSDDLRTWRYVGPFLTTDAVVSADPALHVADIDSPCWECPQLVRLGTRDILIVSVVDRAPKVRPAHVVAFSGQMVGDRFVVEHVERLGLGPDFYAPATVTAPDGRHLLFGWIPEDPPPRRSSRTWAGSFTLPRVIDVDDDGRPRLTLAAEVERFSRRSTRLPDAVVRDVEPWSRSVDDGCFELRVTVVPEAATSIRIDVSGVAGSMAEIRFEPREREFSVARTGLVMVAGRDPHGTTTLPLTGDGAIRLRVILDGSVMELVADERVTATVRLPEARLGPRTISCTTIGGPCRLTDLEISMLAPP